METTVIDTDNSLHRKQSIYESMDERFEMQKEIYRGQQYSQIYFARLHFMRTLFYSLLPSWKPHLPACTVLGLEESKECIIVGTLYKHMKLKPSILDEYSKERSATLLVKPHNFIHPDDQLVLEDESGRVKVRGNVLLPSVFVTGEDKYVVFVSGLSVGSSASNSLQFQLLVDHITGHLGEQKEQSIAAQIVQVVIAGNSVKVPRGLLNGQAKSRILRPKRRNSVLEFMERTLRWRHLAPTAPNTLGCYPFTDKDPFFIEYCPHVYFVGNQDKYETRLLKGSEGQVVRLVCIPRFGETGVAVVLNTRNLECHALSFGTQFGS